MPGEGGKEKEARRIRPGNGGLGKGGQEKEARRRRPGEGGQEKKGLKRRPEEQCVDRDESDGGHDDGTNGRRGGGPGQGEKPANETWKWHTFLIKI